MNCCRGNRILRLARSIHSGVIEIRSYKAKPEFATKYLGQAAESVEIRQKYLSGNFKLFLQPDSGYGTLADFIHIYDYDGGLDQRSEMRSKMGKDPMWQSFLQSSRPCLLEQRSEIFSPARVDGLSLKYFAPTVPTSNTQSIYELRHYQLKAGYDAVPKLLDIFSRGLPDKLSACDRSDGELICLAYSDISILNQFIEIWRYPSPAAAAKHRQESRKALGWRKCIAEAAELTVTFQNRIMSPTSFSPLQ